MNARNNSFIHYININKVSMEFFMFLQFFETFYCISKKEFNTFFVDTELIIISDLLSGDSLFKIFFYIE